MTIDQSQRQHALDPTISFIVQAPAGSGKTELLVRRYLVLLAQSVRAPEEITAITFTRKAAGEMRERILSALHAATLSAPTHPQAFETWQLARAALEQDQRQQWHLLNNPQRLRIQTIDALCLSLTRQMPLLSGFGAMPQTLPDAKDCYLQAARRLLEGLEEQHPNAEGLAHLLLHLDNRLEEVENLLVRMLARRDQWLPYLIVRRKNRSPQALRHMLEEGLRHVVTEILVNCHQHLPSEYHDEILTLLRFAADNLAISDPNHTLAPYRDLMHFPEPLPAHRDTWLAIAQLLLTTENNWRKSLNKTMGFPPENKPMKNRMQNLLTELAAHEAFFLSLCALRESPSPAYTDAEWKIVEILIELLPLLVAQLNVIFREQGVVDFNETAMAALRALGDAESPTELALILDYQIKHLLVDEFQDTSTTQFRLLEKLTAGWQTGDGRTLFLVGDPMQSIYRFREAEVGLFLKAKREGLGAIALESLQLKANFRSAPAIVNWINTQFKNLFPAVVDISSGAVTFNASTAAKENREDSGVSVHPCSTTNPNATSEKILEIIRLEQKLNPQHSIAILVRSRPHLADIIPLLKAQHIAFNAVEIEPLSTQSIVHDLLALTRALWHLGDRLAWLSVLRAPWCGLSLTDLHSIAGKDHLTPIWEALKHSYSQAELSGLSADGKLRLSHLIPILHHSLSERGRQSLRSWVEATWRRLNGPACCQNHNETNTAATFFDLLEQLEADNAELDLNLLVEKIQNSYATPEPAENCRLHVMTIHKAKGLEFDTVIIPHLENKGRSDDAQLLLWLDRPRLDKENDLLLAPIKSKESSLEPIYRYLQKIEKTKTRYEMTRVLYVAATRAKVNLHLIANIATTAEKISEPDPNSFLALLWEPFKTAMQTEEMISVPLIPAVASTSLRKLRRLKHPFLSNWQPLQSKFNTTPTASFLQNISTTQTALSQQIGILIHRCLQEISQEELANWNQQKIIDSRSEWQKRLLQAGIAQNQLEYCLSRIEATITRTLNDPRGRWLLDNTHTDQHSEYAITSLIQGQPQHLIIDRTFVDSEQTRWVIDYKTGILIEEASPDFLKHAQAQHREQLETYARAMSLLDQRPIRLGLYFPGCAGWCEWAHIPSYSHDFFPSPTRGGGKRCSFAGAKDDFR
ncbi:MAG TPA: UvrD-helicase domain-containing protein [Gammaproteobacteria bacterium]|nr:UvrD-helicase domain-containing protein [Gammaproteobacteria bacterium]